jgi:3-oxoacyl-[acyl-carrier-protein] synthase III
MALISRIVGCGSYLPKRIVTNQELAEKVDSSDEWIVSRTGIRQRHIAADGEMTSDLAFEAAKNALDYAGLSAHDIDLIIVGTTTPDKTFPSTAAILQGKLAMTKGAAFDVQAACSGFIYALSVADNFIKSGQAKNVLAIGAETLSRITDWQDRNTCVLFGDGAGAVVLRAEQDDPALSKTEKHGVLSTHLHTDGRLVGILHATGGPSATQTTGHIWMDGKEVFRHAVTNLASVVSETLEAHSLSSSDIDWLVPHQANKRILDGTARKLNFPAEKVVITVDRHANTSSASVPLALDEAVRDGRIQEGSLILMEAMGGGLTWGAALARW